jgi:hypothetical protein
MFNLIGLYDGDVYRETRAEDVMNSKFDDWLYFDLFADG